MAPSTHTGSVHRDYKFWKRENWESIFVFEPTTDSRLDNLDVARAVDTDRVSNFLLDVYTLFAIECREETWYRDRDAVVCAAAWNRIGTALPNCDRLVPFPSRVSERAALRIPFR